MKNVLKVTPKTNIKKVNGNQQVWFFHMGSKENKQRKWKTTRKTLGGNGMKGKIKNKTLFIKKSSTFYS